MASNIKQESATFSVVVSSHRDLAWSGLMPHRWDFPRPKVELKPLTGHVKGVSQHMTQTRCNCDFA